MYSFVYFFMSLLGIFLIFNKKDMFYYQKTFSLILSNLLIIFFLFYNISADKSYYDSFFLHDYFLGREFQGYDPLFYYFAHLISFFQNPQIADLLLYASLIYSIYFFSNKFKNPFHIILLFFPFIFVVVMQGFPRQAWALVFIIIGSNLLFYLNNYYKKIISNEYFVIAYIFFFFLVAIFFHYSAIIFLGVYILSLLPTMSLKNIKIIAFISTISFILINFFIFDFLAIYTIKFQQYIDFLSTRDGYSAKGFIMRFILIIIPSILILIFFIKNIFKKNLDLEIIDRLFVIYSAIYVFFTIIILIKPSLLLILDRLNIYFFLITVYFFGRFIFFSFLKKNYNYFILFSIVYSNIYLFLWSLFSAGYLEFRYNFQLLNHYPVTNLIESIL